MKHFIQSHTCTISGFLRPNIPVFKNEIHARNHAMDNWSMSIFIGEKVKKYFYSRNRQIVELKEVTWDSEEGILTLVEVK